MRGDDIAPFEEHLSGGGGDESEDGAADGGLAAAGLADESEGFAAVDMEGDIIDGLDMAGDELEEARADGEPCLEVLDLEDGLGSLGVGGGLWHGQRVGDLGADRKCRAGRGLWAGSMVMGVRFRVRKGVTAMVRVWKRSVVVGGMCAGVMLAGCASKPVAVTHPRAVLLTDGETRAEVALWVDRVSFFGAAGRSNMMFVQMLDAERPADEGYVFHGGVYTWTSPQGGELGWVDGAGALRAWPPDPVMDVGPGRVERKSEREIVWWTPANRQGLRERKRLALEGEGRAVFEYALVNVGAETVTAGTWVNSAVAGDAKVAVRYGPFTRVWGWNEESIARFRSLLVEREGVADGWTLVDLSRADWEGGGKVYLDSAAEIAIWRDGWWWVRRQTAPIDVERLRAVGEGPVAMYIQPAGAAGVAIIEAELYGPLVEIGAGETHAAREVWELIRSERADVGVLGE